MILAIYKHFSAEFNYFFQNQNQTKLTNFNFFQNNKYKL